MKHKKDQSTLVPSPYMSSVELHNLAATTQSLTEWWYGAAIYQIYPRSFCDSNGDGIGDLPGIIQRLEYIADLGVDGIWLSPFFVSPMNDFGYDVADFCNVDPIFGTLGDFDRLIEKAHSLNLKVTIDQVYSHTASVHPWFEQSRRNKTNDKANWYVWADAKADGSPPNNWQSVFGGSAWAWDARRQQYYLHNFLTSQPDLNLHNEEVQSAVLDVARFWLDRGVDGFRLDALNFCMHDEKLRDNPAATEFKWPPTRPYDYQDHVFNQSQPEILDFVKKIRQVTNSYPGCFTVAEVGGPFPLAEMKAFTSQQTHLNSAYSFEFLYADKITAPLIKRVLQDWPGHDGEGWPSWAFSNHDAPRAISRWNEIQDSAQFAKLLLLALASLRGNIFIYQGEELGLPQAEIAFEDLQDPEAIANWPETFGRDGARTPMPWSFDQKNAGFSSAQPWLPISDEQTHCAVDQLNQDPDSVLAFCKETLAIRNAHLALRHGNLEIVPSDQNLLVLVRRYANQEIACIVNLSDHVVRLPPEYVGKGDIILQVGQPQNNGELLAYSGYIAQL